MHRIVITDLLVIVWAVAGAELIRFGPEGQDARASVGATYFLDVRYDTLTAMLIVAWLVMLHLHGAYDRRLLGFGPEEYKAVAAGSFRLFTVVAIVSYVLRLEVARGYVAIAMPAGMIGLFLSRSLWRKWLTLHRRAGRMSGSVLVVGDREHLVDLIRALDSVPAAGYRVVAACCSEADRTDIGKVPVVGDEAEAAEVAARMGINTVACTSSSRLGAGGLRRLGWALEGQDVDLVVAPGLTDIAGPRVLTRPVAGMSLLHVEAPVFAGPKLAIKTAVDRVGAATLLTLLSPMFMVIAVLIRSDHGGPVLFRQARRLFDVFAKRRNRANLRRRDVSRHATAKNL